MPNGRERATPPTSQTKTIRLQGFDIQTDIQQVNKKCSTLFFQAKYFGPTESHMVGRNEKSAKNID